MGVTVTIDAHELADDGTHRVRVTGADRVALIVRKQLEPYPVWRVEPYPDEGGAGTDDVEEAAQALTDYLRVRGEPANRTLAIPHDPVAASYALSAATPGIASRHQMLLELAGAGERLAAVCATLRRETALLRALRAAVGGADVDVSPN